MFYSATHCSKCDKEINLNTFQCDTCDVPEHMKKPVGEPFNGTFRVAMSNTPSSFHFSPSSVTLEDLSAARRAIEGADYSLGTFKTVGDFSWK